MGLRQYWGDYFGLRKVQPDGNLRRQGREFYAKGPLVSRETLSGHRHA